jgi:hypothetical protein
MAPVKTSNMANCIKTRFVDLVGHASKIINKLRPNLTFPSFKHFYFPIVSTHSVNRPKKTFRRLANDTTSDRQETLTFLSPNLN